MCFSYDKVVHCSPWRLNVPGVFLPCLSPWNKIHVPQQTYHPQNKRYILQKHPNFIPLRSWNSHTSIAFTHKNMYSTSRSLAPLQHLDEQTRPSPASLVANRWETYIKHRFKCSYDTDLKSGETWIFMIFESGNSRFPYVSIFLGGWLHNTTYIIRVANRNFTCGSDHPPRSSSLPVTSKVLSKCRRPACHPCQHLEVLRVECGDADAETNNKHEPFKSYPLRCWPGIVRKTRFYLFVGLILHITLWLWLT